MLAIDHLIVTTTDVRALADDLLARTGLTAVEGGRHPGHGTGNWLVPLGDAYLELLTVVDPDEARTSPFGRWVLDRDQQGLAAVCLRTDDADAVATRLGLTATPMSRVTTDGTELRWRLVGLDDALSPAALPFFIEWDLGDAVHPGRATAPHRTAPLGVTGLELGGDAGRLAARLGDHDLPVRLVGGDPGPHRATIATEAGPVVVTRTGIEA